MVEIGEINTLITHVENIASSQEGLLEGRVVHPIEEFEQIVEKAGLNFEQTQEKVDQIIETADLIFEQTQEEQEGDEIQYYDALTRLYKRLEKLDRVQPGHENLHTFISENRHSYLEKKVSELPEEISEALPKIRELIEESKEYGFTLFAEWIHKNKIELKDLSLSDDEWKKLQPNLTYVDLRDVRWDADRIYKFIENCPNLNILFINNDKIEKLPSGLSSLQRLYCSGCTSLRSLPEGLSSLQELYCYDCTLLRSLPEGLTSLQKLYCSGCTSLRSLPKGLSSLQMLYCDDCTSLRSLPEGLSSLQKLYCSRCTSLQSLPEGLTSLLELYCRGCTALQSLPEGLSSLEELSCGDCPNLDSTSIPELPYYCNVNTGGSIEFLQWEVDLDLLEQNPKSFLKKLGEEYLLKNRPFPNIYYFKDGELSMAIDVGGVRRDFVSRLMENLFQENKETIPFKKSEEGLVFPNDDGTDETKVCLQTLGRLFSFCYPENSYFKTGTVFSDDFFQILTMIKDPDNPTEDEMVEAYGVLKGIPKGVIALAKSDSESSSEESEKDKAYAHQVINPEFFPEKDKPLEDVDPEALRQKMVEDASSETRLQAVRTIASKMDKALLQAKPEELQKRIQGELSEELLLEKMEWHQGVVSDDKFTKTKGFLKSWIKGASDKDLTLFVRVITSNNTLGKDDIKIEMFNRGKEILPTAHTCFFSLELTVDYPNQETFNNKLNLFLQEAMAGSGFQIA